MYHYVGGDDSTPPYGYYHLAIDDFRRQLDYFEANYRILDRSKFLDTVQGDRKPKERDLVLTFDDGLSHHHKYVFPELTDRGLWGLFYIPAGPYLDDTVLDVHRIHTLLGAHGGVVVSEALEEIVTEEDISEAHHKEFVSDIYQNQDNQTGVEHAKRLLNYYIEVESRSRILDMLENRLSNERIQPEDVYMSESEIRDLADAGMHVGSHSVSHTVMSKLPPEEQQKEIRQSFTHLSNLLGKLPIRSYSHPYGGSHSYTDETITFLEEAGCLFSFDVDSRPVTRNVLRNERHRIPRYDCNEFRHGKATVSLG